MLIYGLLIKWMGCMSRWVIEARRWLGDAEEDMRVAKLLEGAGHYASACFHYQQAAEKAVKAALYALGVEARGPSVMLLLRMLGERAGRCFGVRRGC